MPYDEQNVFARILRGEIKASKVYEDEFAFGFKDISPAAPAHVLVIPKGKFISFHDFSTKASAKEMEGFFKAVQKIASELKLDKSGYRLIMNHGPDASQTVHHFHVHILGGRALGGLIPEDAHIR